MQIVAYKLRANIKMHRMYLFICLYVTVYFVINLLRLREQPRTVNSVTKQ